MSDRIIVRVPKGATSEERNAAIAAALSKAANDIAEEMMANIPKLEEERDRLNAEIDVLRRELADIEAADEGAD